MSDVWYYKDNDGEWIKLKYRPDLTSLEDVFEFMEDYPDKRFKKAKIPKYSSVLSEFKEIFFTKTSFNPKLTNGIERAIILKT